jgi:hypothetical protein
MAVQGQVAGGVVAFDLRVVIAGVVLLAIIIALIVRWLRSLGS